MQLPLKTKACAILILIDATDITTKPTVTKNGTQRIGSGFQHARHIISAVVDPLAVIRPAGHEVFIADSLAVQIEFKHPLRSGVYDCPLHRRSHLKLLAQIGRGKILFAFAADREIQLLIFIHRGFNHPVIDRIFQLQLLLGLVSRIFPGKIIAGGQQQRATIHMLLHHCF